MWPTIHAEGSEWEVRVVAGTAEGAAHEDIIEFLPREQTRPPRRLAVRPGTIDTTDEGALLSAFAQARPIGGDHYGRPGKRMSDV